MCPLEVLMLQCRSILCLHLVNVLSLWCFYRNVNLMFIYFIMLFNCLLTMLFNVYLTMFFKGYFTILFNGYLMFIYLTMLLNGYFKILFNVYLFHSVI